MADWRESPAKRFQAAAIAAIGYPLIKTLGLTLRWRVEGLQHLEAVAASGHQPIIALWHGRILPGILFLQRRGIVAITSDNFDGEWAARILHRFGFDTARGSTSRGARKAMRQLVRDMGRGKGAGFTLDGPRGPARLAQPGAIWLAKATGNPVVPFHLEAASHWTVRSWDRTQIPKPFTTVALAIGEPVYVRRDLDAGGLEAARVDLERRLGALEAQARRIVGLE